MLIYCVYLLVYVLSIRAQETGTDLERIDAFHALGKCSHQQCERENKAFTDIIEKTSDLQQKLERCSKCRIKPYEELNEDEKRTLISCIKDNDCETNAKFHEKYKEREEFKQLVKCLEDKCTGQYNAVLKYKESSKLSTPKVDTANLSTVTTVKTE